MHIAGKILEEKYIISKTKNKINKKRMV